MKIRSMTRDDIPSLAAIVGQNYNRHCAEAFHHEAACAFYPYPFPPRFLVAETSDDVLVGCACWNTDWCSWGVFNISWVQVHPSYQRAGIGKSLVAAILAELRPQASCVLLATTKPGYYQRWGFRTIGVYRATMQYENDGEAESLMALYLTEGAPTPNSHDELAALRSANTRVTLENGRLHDEILVLKNVDHRSIKADISIAKQLQASIERNGRMVTRLKRLSGIDPDKANLQSMVDAILKDEEPAWLPA